MKPPPFEYLRAQTLDEAVEGIAQGGEDAKVLAGGQSLVPMMNLRLARPTLLVDINALPLDDVEVRDDTLHVGTLVRHQRLCTDEVFARHSPLLQHAAGFIGHPAIRVRGTLGGSLAHADPSAELALVAVALDARIIAVSSSELREVSARELFQGPFMTTLRQDEMVLAVEWPILGGDDAWGFAEIAERSGDFAEASAAVAVRSGSASVAVTGVAGGPLLLPDVAELLTAGGARPDDVRAAAEAALRQRNGDEDARAVALVAEMVVRAVTMATDRTTDRTAERTTR